MNMSEIKPSRMFRGFSATQERVPNTIHKNPFGRKRGGEQPIKVLIILDLY